MSFHKQLLLNLGPRNETITTVSNFNSLQPSKGKGIAFSYMFTAGVKVISSVSLSEFSILGLNSTGISEWHPLT